MEAFGFIGAGHTFFPHIARFRESIRADSTQPNEVRSLMRIDFSGKAPRLKWVYHSRQWLRPSFHAITYLYRSERGATKIYEFPNDPKLDGPVKFLVSKEDVRVLRYVPRRRLTILVGDRIAKFVRPLELSEVLPRLHIVESQRESAGFVIPRTTESRPELGLFFQELIPGEPTDENAVREAGKVSSRIHQLDPQRLPQAPGAFENLHKDVELISLFQPELKKWLSGIALEVPWPPPDPVFCHGDLRAPHFLFGPNGQVGVIDFDGACRGDLHWELALFITSLKRESQIFSDPQLHLAAEEAYLAGYESEGGRVSREKLRWHRLAAEIHFLARTYQRDLYTPELLKQSIAAIARLSGKELP
jgi:hypothetical protein